MFILGASTQNDKTMCSIVKTHLQCLHVGAGSLST